VDIAAVEKKMVETFGDQYATARVEGVFMDHGSGKKYCVKWTNLKEELKCEYWAGHSLLKDPGAVRPQKQHKIHHPPASAPSADRSSGACLDEPDGGELYLSDPEVSEEDHEEPQNQGVSPLLVGGNLWRHDAAWDALDPRIGGHVSARSARIKFPAYLKAGDDQSYVNCFSLFMHKELIPHLVLHTNLTILDEKLKVSDMERWLIIMFAMTVTPVQNMEGLERRWWWFNHSSSIWIKITHGQKSIRYYQDTLVVADGAKTFHGIRPVQTFFNMRAQSVLQASNKIVINESTCWWHGRDDKRPDCPPALTHMKGKPDPVSFMIKNLCNVETGIIFAI
jgi:hypothetical protein